MDHECNRMLHSSLTEASDWPSLVAQSTVHLICLAGRGQMGGDYTEEQCPGKTTSQPNSGGKKLFEPLLQPGYQRAKNTLNLQANLTKR